MVNNRSPVVDYTYTYQFSWDLELKNSTFIKIKFYQESMLWISTYYLVEVNIRTEPLFWVDKFAIMIDSQPSQTIQPFKLENKSFSLKYISYVLTIRIPILGQLQ